MNLFEVPYVDKTRLTIQKKEHNAAVDMPQMHSHPHYEIYFLLSGERRYLIGHHIYNVSPGNLVFIPKDVPHRTVAVSNKGYDRYVLYFHESYLSDFIASLGSKSFSRLTESGCIQLPPEYAVRVKKSFEQLEEEQENPDFCSAAMQKHILCDILLTVLRCGKEKGCEQKNGSDDIQKAARYICENYASNLTLHDAASFIYMEDTYFSKKFRLLTGVGFHEYLTQTRLKAAESLLVSSDLSVSEIAAGCGFSGSNYFGDVFRRMYGISPSRYRKEMQSACK